MHTQICRVVEGICAYHPHSSRFQHSRQAGRYPPDTTFTHPSTSATLWRSLARRCSRHAFVPVSAAGRAFPEIYLGFIVTFPIPTPDSIPTVWSLLHGSSSHILTDQRPSMQRPATSPSAHSSSERPQPGPEPDFGLLPKPPPPEPKREAEADPTKGSVLILALALVLTFTCFPTFGVKQSAPSLSTGPSAPLPAPPSLATSLLLRGE